MSQIFKYLSSLVNIYSFICFVRIFLTWFPKVNYSQFGRFLSAVCDPYLNIFRKLRFLNFRGLDFSPAVALCVLFGAATILSSLSIQQTLTVGYFLAVFISLIWSLVSSIVNFIIVVLIIRLAAFAIMRLMARGSSYRSYSPLWDSLDNFISPVAFKISKIFVRKIISFTTALIISIVFLIVCVQVANVLVRILCNLVIHLPF